MLKTTYKTNRPQELVAGERPEDFVNAEYRQVFMRDVEPPEDQGIYIVTVNQGWWNQRAKESIHPRNLSTETFATYDQADAAFDLQVRHLATIGFIHAYTPVPVPPEFVQYEELEKPGK